MCENFTSTYKIWVKHADPPCQPLEDSVTTLSESVNSAPTSMFSVGFFRNLKKIIIEDDQERTFTFKSRETLYLWKLSAVKHVLIVDLSTSTLIYLDIPFKNAQTVTKSYSIYNTWKIFRLRESLKSVSIQKTVGEKNKCK